MYKISHSTDLKASVCGECWILWTCICIKTTSAKIQMTFFPYPLFGLFPYFYTLLAYNVKMLKYIQGRHNSAPGMYLQLQFMYIRKAYEI